MNNICPFMTKVASTPSPVSAQVTHQAVFTACPREKCALWNDTEIRCSFKKGILPIVEMEIDESL